MPDTTERENMKKLGVIAVILIVALLAIGVASALAANETYEKSLTIKAIGPDTLITTSGTRTIEFATNNWAKSQKYTLHVENNFSGAYKNDEVDVKVEKGAVTTSNGQVFKIIFHNIHNSSSLASINNIPFQGPGPKIGYVHNSSLKEVSGSVASGYAGLQGPFSWNAGDPVRISATWTPANQDVFLGIYDMAQELPYVDLKRGGSGTYATTVPYTSSQWAFIIWNVPSNTAMVDYNLI
jgi:hypothetical protein